MVKLIIAFILIFFVAVSCKKKTTIKARVYNYAMGEPLSGAKVDLVQKKEVGSLSGSSSNCEVVTSAVTDANGYCIFDGEKLKAASKYEYFLGVSSAYGISQTYPCGGKTSGFLNVGEDNDVKLNVSYIDTYFKVQYNNLLNPSQIGDTLEVGISNVAYYDHDGYLVNTGGGVW